MFFRGEPTGTAYVPRTAVCPNKEESKWNLTTSNGTDEKDTEDLLFCRSEGKIFSRIYNLYNFRTSLSNQVQNLLLSCMVSGLSHVTRCYQNSGWQRLDCHILKRKIQIDSLLAKGACMIYRVIRSYWWKDMTAW